MKTETDEIKKALKNMGIFSSLATAKLFAYKLGVKSQWIMKGENGLYLVGLPKDTEILHKAGYKYIDE